jgi:hypothetical protein
MIRPKKGRARVLIRIKEIKKTLRIVDFTIIL